MKSSQDLKIKIHLIVAFYGTILLVLVIILVLMNSQSVKKEQQIVDFLPFVDIKQVMNKIQFYDRFTDYMKENE